MQYKYCYVYQHVNLRTVRENGIEKSRTRFSIFVSLHRSHVLPCEDGKTILPVSACRAACAGNRRKDAITQTILNNLK